MIGNDLLFSKTCIFRRRYFIFVVFLDRELRMNVGIDKSIVLRLGQLKFRRQLCTSQTETPGVKYLTFVVVNDNIWLIR